MQESLSFCRPNPFSVDFAGVEHHHPLTRVVIALLLSWLLKSWDYSEILFSDFQSFFKVLSWHSWHPHVLFEVKLKSVRGHTWKFRRFESWTFPCGRWKKKEKPLILHWLVDWRWGQNQIRTWMTCWNTQGAALKEHEEMGKRENMNLFEFARLDRYVTHELRWSRSPDALLPAHQPVAPFLRGRVMQWVKGCEKQCERISLNDFSEMSILFYYEELRCGAGVSRWNIPGTAWSAKALCGKVVFLRVLVQCAGDKDVDAQWALCTRSEKSRFWWTELEIRWNRDFTGAQSQHSIEIA